MTASMNADSDLALFREDLDAVKRDVASLIEHMKGGATNTVQNAACQVERRIGSVRRQAGAEGERSAKALNLFVQNRPFVALTIAVGAGYIGARVLRAVSQPSTAGDLVQIALAVLQPGAPRAGVQPTDPPHVSRSSC